MSLNSQAVSEFSRESRDAADQKNGMDQHSVQRENIAVGRGDWPGEVKHGPRDVQAHQ